MMKKTLVFATLLFLVFAVNSQVVLDGFENDTIERFVIPKKTESHWLLFDTVSRSCIPDKFDDLILDENETNDLYFFRKNGAFGAVSQQGEIVLEFIYDSIKRHRDLFACRRSNNSIWDIYQYGIIDNVEADSVFIKFPLVYFFKNGKTGLIDVTGIKTKAIYDGIVPWIDQSGWQEQNLLYLSFIGGYYQVLDKTGNALLPENVTEVQHFEFGLIKFKHEEIWKYYLPENEEIISSNGNDIVFYNSRTYKKYNTDRTNSVLVYEKQPFSGGFDDYFPLSNKYIAVRKDDKIGLIDGWTKKLYIKPKYDKIEYLNDDKFKFYVGDSCGLMDVTGREIIPAEYGNIATSNDPEYFVVFKNGKGGLKHLSNKMILPIEYEFISVNGNCIVIQKNNRKGLSDLNGNIIVTPDYKGSSILFNSYFTEDFDFNLKDYFDNFIFVFYNEIGHFDLYSSNGKRIDVNVNYQLFENDILKTYKGNVINVYTFDDQNNINDRMSYDNVNSFQILSNEMNKYNFVLNVWNVSYLSESQKNGYFGLKNYTDFGYTIEPSYDHVKWSYFGFIFGERFDTKGQWSLAENINLDYTSTYDEFSESTGKQYIVNQVMSEDMLYFYNSNSDVTLGYLNNGSYAFGDYIHHPIMSYRNENSRVIYAENLHERLRKYLVNGSAVLCSVDTADVSLFEYFNWMNSLGIMKPDNSGMISIMNPCVGVKFKDSKTVISDVGLKYSDIRLYEDFSNEKAYKSFEFDKQSELIVATDINGEKNIRNFVIPDNKQQTIIKNISAYSINHDFDYVKVLENSPKQAKLHKDYPLNPVFINEQNIQFVEGRIIRKKDLLYALVCPDNSVVLDGVDEIRYLNDGLFGYREGTIWRIIKKDGELLTDIEFVRVNQFEKGLSSCQGTNTFYVLDNKGNVISSGSTDNKHFQEQKWIVNTESGLIHDYLTSKEDLITPKEKYLGNDFIYGSNGKEKYVRRFGNKEYIIIPEGSVPKRFMNLLYLKADKHVYLIDSNLVLSKHKNCDKPQLLWDEYLVLEKRKEKLVLNPNGNIIFLSKPDVRIETIDNNLYAISDDTTLQIKAGSVTVNQDEEVVPDASVAEYEVFQSGGKYGVKNQSDNVVVPAVYDFITVNEKDFTVTFKYKWFIYDFELNPLNETGYNEIHAISNDLFLVKTGESYYVIDLKGKIVE